MPQKRPDPPRPTGMLVGLLVTNSIKLGGLAVVLEEVFTRSEPRPGTLAVSAFMMAGAQGIESLLDWLKK